MTGIGAWNLWGLLVTLIQVAGLLHALHALFCVRTSQGTVAWILFLVVFPWLAIPLYWIFGRNKFSGYALSRRAGNKCVGGALEHVKHSIDSHQTDRPFDIAHLDGMPSLTGLPCTDGNAIQLFDDGVATFEAMLSDIVAAQEYVLIQFFIVQDGELASRFQRILADKVQAGVRVFFLYDEFGSRKVSKRYLKQLCQDGIEVESFRTTRGRGNQFQLNFRNHRKVTVIDGRVGFVGGLNLGDEYIGKHPRLKPWRDTHVRLEGPCVLQIQTAFVEDWHWARKDIPKLSWNPTSATSTNWRTLVVPTGPADNQPTCQIMLLNLIAAAKKRLWIASPYFVPDEAVLAALCVAPTRGVDVRIMLPKNPDHRLVYLAAYSYYNEMLKCGITIHRFQPGFMHQKVILVDKDLAAIGTVNLDNRSIHLNFEITIIVPETPFATEVTQMLQRDFEQCRPASLDDLTGRGLVFRSAVQAARLFAPIL